MQTRSKTAAARNRLASKSESELAEPPLRIGCFNLNKFGKMRRNSDVTSVLLDVLKRYDLLLIMEPRTTTETNIDRLIQRLSKIDESSPFDYELSEAPCRMHGLKEQYCFFYRCHKLSVLHVHCYGDDPLSGKGWGKGHPRAKAAASHHDTRPVDSCTSIVTSTGSLIRNRAESSVSFSLPEDLGHHSAESVLGPDQNKKREASLKESESSLISAMSFDNVVKDSGSASSTSKNQVTASDRGFGIGLRKSTSTVNLLMAAMMQEVTTEEDGSDSHFDDKGSRGQEKDEEEAGCALGLRKSARSVNIPQVALSQDLVGRLIQSIYDDDDDDDDDEPPVTSKREETGSRGKVNDEKEAGCALGLRKSAPSVNIPQDACRQSDEALEESGHSDDGKRHRVYGDSSDEDEVEQKGRGIGLSKSKSHVSLPQEALRQNVSELLEDSMDDHQQEEMDRSDENYTLDDKSDDRSVAKGCEIGLRKSMSCVNLPLGALLNSRDKFVKDDDNNDDDTKDIPKGREIGLKKSVSCVNLPLRAILLTSDSDEEESPHRDISLKKPASSANILNITPLPGGRKTSLDETSPSGYLNCDSSESMPDFDVGLKKSMSCVNLVKSLGKLPSSGILRGWTVSESGARYDSRKSGTKMHGHASSKVFHTKKLYVAKVKAEGADTCPWESSVHFADHPEVKEMSSESCANLIHAVVTGGKRDTKPASSKGKKESEEWPEHKIGLRKSASHVNLPLAANRQSEELVTRRQSDSIEEIDEHREVEIGIRKSKSSFNLADSLHLSDTTWLAPWPTDPLLEEDEDAEYVYESALRSDLDELSSPVEAGLHELVGLHKSFSCMDLTSTDALFFGNLHIVDESGSSLDKLDKKPDALTEASEQLDQLSRKGDLAAARSAKLSQPAKQSPSPKPKSKGSKFCCTRGNNSDTDLPNVKATAGPSPTTSKMAAATRAASNSAPVKGNRDREITQIMEEAPQVSEMNPPPVQSTSVTKQKPQMVAESPDPVKGENQNAKNSTTSMNHFEQNRPTESCESGVRADSAIVVTADLSGSCSISQANTLFAGNIKSQYVTVNQPDTFSDQTPDALTITSLPTDPMSYLSDDIYSSCSTMPSVTDESRHERGQAFVSIPQTRPIPPTDTVTDSSSKTSTTRFADSAKVYCQKLTSRIHWTGPPKCKVCERRLEEASAKTICELCITCKREILEKRSKLQKTENKESVNISENKNQNTSVEDNNTDSDVTIICRKKKTGNSGFVLSPPHSRSTDSTVHTLWTVYRSEEDTRKHRSGPRRDVNLQHRTHKAANQERKRNEKKIIIQQQRVEGCAEIISWQNHNAWMDCHDMPVENESTETHILSSEEAEPTSQFTNLPTERKDTRGATHTARKNAYGDFKDNLTENPNTEDQNMLGHINEKCEDPDVAAGYQDTCRDLGNVHQNHSTSTVNKTPPASNPCSFLGRKNVCADKQGIVWKTPNSSEEIPTTSTKMNKIKSTENLNTLSEIKTKSSASRHFKSERKQNTSCSIQHTSTAVNNSTHMERMNTSTDIMNSSTDIMNTSTDIMNSSTDIMNTSTDIMNTSTDIMNTSTDIMNSSTDIMNTSTDIMNSSTDIMNSSSSSFRSVNKSISEKRNMPVTNENISSGIHNTFTTVKNSIPIAVRNSHNTPTDMQDTSRDCQETALDNQKSSTDINTSTEYENTAADVLNTLTDSQNATTGKQNVSNHSQRGGQNTSRYSYTSSTENKNTSTKNRNTSTGNRNKSTENPNTSKENQNISSQSERQRTSTENQNISSENQNTPTETQNTFGDSQNSLRVSVNTSTENQNTFRDSQHALTVSENTSTENQNTNADVENATHLCYRMGSLNRVPPPPDTGPGQQKVFCREPFAVHFLSPLTDVTEFAVIVVHTYSHDAKAEVCAIQRIYDITSSKWYLQNMVLMGDFGMDESDRGMPYWRGVAVKSDRRFTKLLNDPENSDAPSARDRNYDRLVLVGRDLNKACIPSSVDCYRYDLELKLNDEQTAHVSDHYPLELQLAGLATTRWQKHVRTKGGVTIEQVHQVSTSADLKRLCKTCKGQRASANFQGEVLFDGPTGKAKEIRATRSDVTDVVKCLKDFQQAFPNILKDTTVSVASSFVTSPWMTASPVYGLTFESDVKYAVTIIVTLQPPHMCQVHLQRQLCDGFTNDDETRLNYWTT
ncbi:serine-rich adhesin for platelets-like [Littorina saxatilis]